MEEKLEELCTVFNSCFADSEKERGCDPARYICKFRRSDS